MKDYLLLLKRRIKFDDISKLLCEAETIPVETLELEDEFDRGLKN